MNFIAKKIKEQDSFRLIKENPDGTGVFIYKGESVILKRCKNGYWKDPKTGECVPSSQLQGTSQPKEVKPKDEVQSEPQKEPKQEEPKVDAPKKPTAVSVDSIKAEVTQLVPKKLRDKLDFVEEGSAKARGFNAVLIRIRGRDNTREEGYKELKEALKDNPDYDIEFNDHFNSVVIYAKGEQEKHHQAEEQYLKEYQERVKQEEQEQQAKRDKKRKDIKDYKDRMKNQSFEEFEASRTEEDKAKDRYGVNEFLASLDNPDDYVPRKVNEPIDISEARFVSAMWEEDKNNSKRSEEDRIVPAPHTKYFDRPAEDGYKGYKNGSATIPKDAYVIENTKTGSLYFYDRKRKAWGWVKNGAKKLKG